MAGNVHLIVGADDFLVESAAKRILHAAVSEELRATAIEIVDGDAGNCETQLASIASCRTSLQTPPFFDPVKATWWRGVSFLPGGPGRKPAEDVKEALVKFADELSSSPLPSNQIFVVTAPSLLTTSIFAKKMNALGEMIVFDTPSKSQDRIEEAAMRLPRLAEEVGVSFEQDAEAAFIAKTGSNTRTIVSELEKLRDYLGDEKRKVTQADVAEITSVSSSEPEIWELTAAMTAHEPAKLAKILSAMNPKSMGLIVTTVMERYFREATVCRDAMDRGWLDRFGTWSKKLPPQAAETMDTIGLGPKTAKPWNLKRTCRAASAFTMGALRVGRWWMLDLRRKLVTSGADSEIVTTKLLEFLARYPAPRRT